MKQELSALESSDLEPTMLGEANTVMLRLKAYERLYARLKKQLAALVPEQTAQTPAREKRGIKPNPNYVPDLVDKIKKFYC